MQRQMAVHIWTFSGQTREKRARREGEFLNTEGHGPPACLPDCMSAEEGIR